MSKKMKRLTMPWQKNFREIPKQILLRTKEISTSNVSVAAIKIVSLQSISDGIYDHLGFTIDGKKVSIPERIIPDKNVGLASKYNIEVKEIIHKDLPKTTSTYSVTVPDWGDWSKGSHDIDFTRDAYRRTYIKPLMLEISMTVLETNDATVKIKFEVERTLDPNDKDFKKNLLNDINLLQENTGVCNVFKSNTTLDEYKKTISVTWEILPIGTKEQVLTKIFKLLKMTKANDGIIEERYDILEKLSPINWVAGSSGMQRYFGAMFENNVVVFENVRYGNAIYLMKNKWEELSKKTRGELVRDYEKEIVRIIHRKGWQGNLRTEIRKAVRAKK
jgi:hypothetical protein